MCSRVYDLIGDGKLIAKKSGSSTLVKARSAIEYMESLPAAKIARSKKSAGKAPKANAA